MLLFLEHVVRSVTLIMFISAALYWIEHFDDGECLKARRKMLGRFWGVKSEVTMWATILRMTSRCFDVVSKSCSVVKMKWSRVVIGFREPCDVDRMVGLLLPTRNCIVWLRGERTLQFYSIISADVSTLDLNHDLNLSRKKIRKRNNATTRIIRKIKQVPLNQK